MLCHAVLTEIGAIRSALCLSQAHAHGMEACSANTMSHMHYCHGTQAYTQTSAVQARNMSQTYNCHVMQALAHKANCAQNRHDKKLANTHENK
jgi:hypothetical protein